MTQWTDILTPEMLAARAALIASIDPAFAAAQTAFYAAQTVPQLKAIIAGAWTANDPENYQIARSYLALKGGAA